MPDTYERAYALIIHQLLSFGRTHTYGETQTSGDHSWDKKYPSYGMVWRSSSQETPVQPGDLVVPTSAPMTEWDLSWYVSEKKIYYKDVKLDDAGNPVLDNDGKEIIFENPERFEREHLLKSVKTGKLCNWSNIGIEYLDRKELKDYPSFKWTDKQFEFNDRWQRVCNKIDGYITIPLLPIFHDDKGKVTLETRKRWSDPDPTRLSRTFENYKKVTIKMMTEFYHECRKQDT